MKHLIWLFVVVALVGCGGGSEVSKITTHVSVNTYSIDHYLVSCYWPFPSVCFKPTEADDNGRIPAYVSGFDYEWGYQYQIEVETTVVNNPAISKPMISYRLLSLISKEQVSGPTSFMLAIEEADLFLEETADNQFRIFDSKDFTCLSASDCSLLVDLLEQEMSVKLEFFHAEDKTQPLQLSKIDCFAPLDDFSNNCG